MNNVLPFLLVLLIVSSCSTSTKEQTQSSSQRDLVIYGSSECSHCIDFMKEMDQEGITYTFNDVEKSDKYVTDMLDWVRSSGHQGRINYPVIVIDYKEVLVAPEPTAVLDIL